MSDLFRRGVTNRFQSNHNYFIYIVCSFLISEWFLMLRNIAIATVPLVFICMALCLVILYKYIRHQYKTPSVTKQTRLTIFYYCTAALQFFTGNSSFYSK